MQVHELVEVAEFLKRFLAEKSLAQEYKNLANCVQQASNNQEPQQVDKQLEKIREIHLEADKLSLSPSKTKLMEEFGAQDLLGLTALKRIDEIFQKHRAHPQGLIQAINHLESKTQQLSKRSSSLVSSLDPLIESIGIDEDETEDGEGKLWLYFADGSSVNTIEDLEKVAEVWKQILHHFSRMPDASDEAGRILYIRKHSPLEMELAANLHLLAPLAFGIHWVLKEIKHVIIILQEAEKLKGMKIKNEIIEDLRKEADEHRKRIADHAAKKIKEKFTADSEAEAAAKKALIKIIDFVENGGRLDIDLKKEKSSDSENEEPEGEETIELKGFIEDIRKDLKLLEASEEGEPGEDGNG